MISVFLSYPKPFNTEQEVFIEQVISYLKHRGFEPRTLGVSDYDVNEPLSAIRRLMLESNGILVVAFRRTLIEKGVYKPKSKSDEKILNNSWITSPYTQIEPAMAFQIGLPILILRENGVLADGILERGVIGTYMPEFSLEDVATDYFSTPEWNQLIGIWEGNVRSVVKTKGTPPKLF